MVMLLMNVFMSMLGLVLMLIMVSLPVLVMLAD